MIPSFTLSPYQEFQAQNNLLFCLPGFVTRLPGDPLYDLLNNPTPDDDFLRAGDLLPSGFNGLLNRLVVPNDEPASAWEHSLTIGDPINRLNFRLTEAQAVPATWIRVVAEFATGGEAGPDNGLRGFEITRWCSISGTQLGW